MGIMNETQAVILAGGLGTRIRSVNPDLPKALIPVNGKPFLERQIDWLYGKGIDKIHLALGHGAPLIQDWIISKSFSHLNLSVSVEAWPIGTAGALKWAEPCFKSDPFIVVNGDTILPNLDLEGFIESSSNCLLTIVAVKTDNTERFGAMEIDSNDKILSFREKELKGTGRANGGVYAISARLMDKIERGKKLSLEENIFPGIVRDSQAKAFPCKPPLLDMGTPEGLEEMGKYFQQ